MSYPWPPHLHLQPVAKPVFEAQKPQSPCKSLSRLFVSWVTDLASRRFLPSLRLPASRRGRVGKRILLVGDSHLRQLTRAVIEAVCGSSLDIPKRVSHLAH